MLGKPSDCNHSGGTSGARSDALQKHLDALKSLTDKPARTVTPGKTCAICGKAFKWYWRCTYECYLCHAMICSNCYLNGMLPQKVRAYDYEEYPICLTCVPTVQKEMEEQNLQIAVSEYQTGFADGKCDGQAGFPNNASVSGGSSAHFLKGYNAGHEKGFLSRCWKQGLQDGLRNRETIT